MTSKGHRLEQIGKGFTIVELLIVIVVIGILAAITIIAYNGISSRAKIASLQSDLQNASQLIKIDMVNTGLYPATVAAANNGQGLKATAGTSYQYTVDNTPGAPAFCLTATTGTISNYITQDGTPLSGACTGHVNGSSPVITNLSVNPSMETNLTGWGSWSGTGGVTVVTNPATGGYAGSKFGHLAWTTGTSAISGGPSYNITASAGTQYAASVWVRASKVQKVYMEMKYLNGGTTLSTPGSTPVVIPANTWTNISSTSTSPATTNSLTVGVYASNSSGGALWVAGDYIDYDATIVTQGSTNYSFADGTTSLWSWSGAPNNSTSSGPSLP